jgi:hypothetical protein
MAYACSQDTLARYMLPLYTCISVNRVSYNSRLSLVSSPMFNFHCAKFGVGSYFDGIYLLRMCNRVLSIYRFQTGQHQYKSIEPQRAQEVCFTITTTCRISGSGDWVRVATQTHYGVIDRFSSYLYTCKLQNDHMQRAGDREV